MREAGVWVRSDDLISAPPRLEQRLPQQAAQKELDVDPLRHRFTLVFDRESYSPDFLQRRKDQRIACLTYHKFPGEDWPEDEFAPVQVQLPSGETVAMDLAERGTRLRNGLWLREHLKRPDEARRLRRALYSTETDLLPDPEAGTLTVRLHHSANAATDGVIEKRCQELNETATLFPRTNLRLVLKLGSA